MDPAAGSVHALLPPQPPAPQTAQRTHAGAQHASQHGSSRCRSTTALHLPQRLLPGSCPASGPPADAAKLAQLHGRFRKQVTVLALTQRQGRRQQKLWWIRLLTPGRASSLPAHPPRSPACYPPATPRAGLHRFAPTPLYAPAKPACLPACLPSNKLPIHPEGSQLSVIPSLTAGGRSCGWQPPSPAPAPPLPVAPAAASAPPAGQQAGT